MHNIFISKEFNKKNFDLYKSNSLYKKSKMKIKLEVIKIIVLIRFDESNK